VIPFWYLRIALVVGSAFSLCAVSAGETWFVNNESGRDTYDGRSAESKGDGVHGPFATLKRAVSALGASDRLEIIKTALPYREVLSIAKGGTPDRPVVVDGHGATIDGLGLVPAPQWKPEADGTFSTEFRTNANKLERVKDVMTWIGSPQIWFVDGRPAPNVTSRAELAATPGGFYWNKGEHRLYYRPAAGKKLADLRIEIPVRGTGIVVHGADYIVVQNLRSVHSLNDGIGTAGCRGVVFRNLDGSDNCDQGFSAHQGAVNIIEDCRFERNAGSGICDVNNSVTIYRRCLVAHNTFESGAYFLNEGFHLMEDCALFDNADGPQVMASGEGVVQLHNCLVCGKGGNATPLIELQGSNIKLDNCTITDGVVGVRMASARGALQISNCLFSRCPQALLVVPKGDERRFKSDYNGWHLGVLDFGGQRYTAATWLDYQKVSHQDAHSLTIDPQFPANLPPGADSSWPAMLSAFTLPGDSPYLTAGEKGRRIGVNTRRHAKGPN
jgi:hypothetical protein